MSNIWFPVPVALFLRRVLNILSTLSITHHYLLPQRSTNRHSHASELRSQPADRVMLGNRRPYAESYIMWTAIVENSLDGILQASGRLSIPWIRWPARLSLFHPASRSANYVQHPKDQVRVEKMNQCSSDPNSCPPPQGPPEPANSGKEGREDRDEIHRLIQNPVLYDPLRAPRYPIVLCHGLYGFDVRGPSSFPSLRMQYWSSILNILRKTVGAEVIVTAVPGTGSITSRAEQLNRFLQIRAVGRGINFMAHSMGGLDCRHLISRIKPEDYTPLSLTTVATPHRGSPFMDWCQEYLGLGRRRQGEEEPISPRAITKSLATMGAAPEAPNSASGESSSPSSPSPVSSISSLPSSFTTFLLGMFDSPAYANLTTTYLTEIFNPRTPDDPRVRYFSVAGRTEPLNIWHPLWLPKLILDGADGGEGNDGLVSVHSARWGEFLGILEGADHWTLRGASSIELDVDLPSVVSEPWSRADWGRIMRALGRAERQEGGIEGEQKADRWQEEVRTARDERTLSDQGLKSSTDRLSAVFDWLVEQVPAGTRNGFSFAGDGDSRGGSGAGSGAGQSKDSDAGLKAKVPVAPQKPRGDLESKRDLERFYVALARKLYDEGL